MAKSKKAPVTVLEVESPTGPIENPKFNCSFNGIDDPRNLKPHPENPNFHPKTQILNYIEIIKFNGWRRPITVSKNTGFIVKGHGGCLAAIQAGWTEVPVDFQEYASFEAELADLLADNELGNQSEQNDDKVKEIMTDLLESDFNIDVTGFTTDALADVMKPKIKKSRAKKREENEDAKGRAVPKFFIKIGLMSQDDRADLYDELRDRGYEAIII